MVHLTKDSLPKSYLTVLCILRGLCELLKHFGLMTSLECHGDSYGHWLTWLAFRLLKLQHLLTVKNMQLFLSHMLQSGKFLQVSDCCKISCKLG